METTPHIPPTNSSRSSATGAIVYDDYRDNFVVVPGSEDALKAFVSQSYAGQQHKVKATRSSNQGKRKVGKGNDFGRRPAARTGFL